ncbi:MAG: NusA-like transcription termination signal-binding factor [Candidatus Diapherotrites archaeon]|nr:NusA-like transcription termination signal-binding factor [Candidatus Diapherotrites archaeon]
MKITNQELLYMNALGDIARIAPRSCFLDSSDKIVFVVNSDDISKAIGKDGLNIKRLREKLGKNIEVVPYAKTAEDFSRKFLRNITISEIKQGSDENNNNIIILKFDNNERTKVRESFGKIKRLKELIKTSYGIHDVKIEYTGT